MKFGELSRADQAFLHSQKANKREGGFYQDWHDVREDDLDKLSQRVIQTTK